MRKVEQRLHKEEGTEDEDIELGRIAAHDRSKSY